MMNEFGLVAEVEALAECLRCQKRLLAVRNMAQDDLDTNEKYIRAHRMVLARESREAGRPLVVVISGGIAAYIPFVTRNPSDPSFNSPVQEIFVPVAQ